MPKIAAAAFPPGPSDSERQRRGSMARQEYARLKALYRERIKAEMDREAKEAEARRVEEQAAREQEAEQAAAWENED